MEQRQVRRRGGGTGWMWLAWALFWVVVIWLSFQTQDRAAGSLNEPPRMPQGSGELARTVPT
jgi:hypothetical protein